MVGLGVARKRTKLALSAAELGRLHERIRAATDPRDKERLQVAQSTTCMRSLSRAAVVVRIACLIRASSGSLRLNFVRFLALRQLAHTHQILHGLSYRLLSGNGMRS